MGISSRLAAMCLLLCSVPAYAQIPDLPAALYRDPEVDAQYPAMSSGIQFESHGSTVNGTLFRPAGKGVHPTVILFHGLPGNEQNLDLLRAIQRAGWTAITFHYRGAWGSGGVFTLAGGVEDGDALLSDLARPGRAAAWGVDTKHVVVIGHSYGGYIAAATLARHAEIRGAVLIAPWDLSYDQRRYSQIPEAQRAKQADIDFDDARGRLGSVTAKQLSEDLLANGGTLDLARLAPSIASRPILLLTATRDDPDDQAEDLIASLRKLQAPQFSAQSMQTDHSFDDRRIALQAAILKWLALR
jgi:pimeloyl-ACP methyl ester carboxylesterase